MLLYSNYKATISIPQSPFLHDRTKYIEIDKHFTEEKIDQGIICIPYRSTIEQIAEVLIKGLQRWQFPPPSLHSLISPSSFTLLSSSLLFGRPSTRQQHGSEEL